MQSVNLCHSRSRLCTCATAIPAVLVLSPHPFHRPPPLPTKGFFPATDNRESPSYLLIYSSIHLRTENCELRTIFIATKKHKIQNNQNAPFMFPYRLIYSFYFKEDYFSFVNLSNHFLLFIMQSISWKYFTFKTDTASGNRNKTNRMKNPNSVVTIILPLLLSLTGLISP